MGQILCVKQVQIQSHNYYDWPYSNHPNLNISIYTYSIATVEHNTLPAVEACLGLVCAIDPKSSC